MKNRTENRRRKKRNEKRKKRKRIEAHRVKRPTPSQATNALTGDEEQNGKQKRAKRKKQGVDDVRRVGRSGWDATGPVLEDE